MQDAFNAIEEFPFPVIAAAHGACIGGATNLIAACDIRFSTKDAFFSIREVDLGLACDLGALQRIPKSIGHSSWFREMCFTARNFGAKEAKDKGFISETFETREAMTGT